MILYVLMIYLVGNPIPIEEGKPTTLDLCKKDGFRVVRDYQAGGVRAQFDCDPLYVEPPQL